MQAYCNDCQKKMLPGFHTTVTPTSYECNEDGDVTEFNHELLQEWQDGVVFHGWWCSECGEWYNNATFKEEEHPNEDDEDESTPWERLAEIVGDGEFDD